MPGSGLGPYASGCTSLLSLSLCVLMWHCSGREMLFPGSSSAPCLCHFPSARPVRPSLALLSPCHPQMPSFISRVACLPPPPAASVPRGFWSVPRCSPSTPKDVGASGLSTSSGRPSSHAPTLHSPCRWTRTAQAPLACWCTCQGTLGAHRAGERRGRGTQSGCKPSCTPNPKGAILREWNVCRAPIFR